MNLLQAILLAIIEGLTEFLPVSSTGHIIIGSVVMGITSDHFIKLFTVAIQLGAILSVIVLYRKRFFQSLDFYFKLLVAFIPSAFFGILFNDFIDELLENAVVVGFALVLGGVVFLFIDKWFTDSTEKDNQNISYLSALKIGLFQIISMVPGVSRSAATIIGGLTQNLNRKSAAEFSFFLAVPTMFGATVKKMYDYYSEGYSITPEQINLLLIGNIVAFAVAMLAIKTFITFLTKNGFRVFGYYRIIIGLLILFIHFFFHPLLVV